jgi:hypothetical protein
MEKRRLFKMLLCGSRGDQGTTNSQCSEIDWAIDDISERERERERRIGVAFRK